VNINDMVRIVSGPLMEHAGQVVAVKSKSVKIILPSLGYMMSAEVELDKVEVISNSLRFFVGNQGKLMLG
jgi:transcription antitermination factor NusG